MCVWRWGADGGGGRRGDGGVSFVWVGGCVCCEITMMTENNKFPTGKSPKETTQAKSKRIKGSNERYLLGQKHSLHIFWVITFIKLLNDT